MGHANDNEQGVQENLEEMIQCIREGNAVGIVAPGAHASGWLHEPYGLVSFGQMLQENVSMMMRDKILIDGPNTDRVEVTLKGRKCSIDPVLDDEGAITAWSWVVREHKDKDEYMGNKYSIVASGYSPWLQQAWETCKNIVEDLFASYADREAAQALDNLIDYVGRENMRQVMANRPVQGFPRFQPPGCSYGCEEGIAKWCENTSHCRIDNAKNPCKCPIIEKPETEQSFDTPADTAEIPDGATA